MRGFSALAGRARSIAAIRPRHLVEFCAKPAVILTAITVFAAVRRLHLLGSQSFWSDEAETVTLATMPWPAMKHVVLTRETNMGLYFLFMRAWTALGTTESIFRMPSAIASIATIPLLYLAGRRLFGSSIALAAALLFAANPMGIAYAQESRSYSIEVMLVAASWLFFLRTIDRSSAGNLAGWVLATTLAVYAHSLAFLAIPAQLVPLLIVRRRNAPWFQLLAGAALVGLLVLPLAILAARNDAGQLDWISPLNWSYATHELVKMTGVMVFDSSGNAFGTLCGFAVLLAIAELVTGFKRSREDAAPYLFAACAVLVPFALSAAVSFFKPLLLARYLIFSLPMVCLLAAAGCWMVRSAVGRAGLLAAIVAAGLWHDTVLTTTYRREDWRAVALAMRLGGVRGDAVVVYYAPNRWSLDYYLRRMHIAPGFFDFIYPDWDANLEIDGHFTTDRDAKAILAAELLKGISSAADNGRRVWFIYDRKTWDVFPPNASVKTVYSLLRRRYRVLALRSVHGVGVLLFSWPQPPRPYRPPPSR
ncbi:MAG TPA: glycosyltransferase family 39 protein [Candidatus Binataceae bacterium]|nr:glycosyltransferase family 39 protein [Candidatus Binataceae bacterium]